VLTTDDDEGQRCIDSCIEASPERGAVDGVAWNSRNIGLHFGALLANRAYESSHMGDGCPHGVPDNDSDRASRVPGEGLTMSAHRIELVVQGRLWPSLLTALDGFEIDTNSVGQTVIVGQVDDQAQLFGLLDLFAGLHVEVVSVNRIDEITA
jgi:hypothetical protein